MRFPARKSTGRRRQNEMEGAISEGSSARRIRPTAHARAAKTSPAEKKANQCPSVRAPVLLTRKCLPTRTRDARPFAFGVAEGVSLDSGDHGRQLLADALQQRT